MRTLSGTRSGKSGMGSGESGIRSGDGAAVARVFGDIAPRGVLTARRSALLSTRSGDALEAWKVETPQRYTFKEFINAHAEEWLRHMAE